MQAIMSRVLATSLVFSLILLLPHCNNVEESQPLQRIYSDAVDRSVENALRTLIVDAAAIADPYYFNRCPVSAAPYTGPVSPISFGYGSLNTGFRVASYSVTNPTTSLPTCVYVSTNTTESSPVIVLIHGFGSPSAEPYFELIQFMTSLGYVVVFPIYPDNATSVSAGYIIMEAGIDAAISAVGSLADTSRVGFMGHSLGAGALPAIAYNKLVEQGWGTNGNFIYMMAPWYSYDISNAELASFPTNTNLLMQVYQHDTVTDHRMAIDIFNNINVPAEDKDYVTIFSDASSGYNYNADHYVPIKYVPTGIGNYDAHDFYGVFRLTEALADYTFTGNGAGYNIALGNGNSEQTFMGTYADGSEVTRMGVTDSPSPLFDESFYSQPFSGSLNPRR